MHLLVRLSLVIGFLVSGVSGAQDADGAYPTSPHLDVTPGGLCEHPSEYRYPEKIPYCKRDVHSDIKREIMIRYDQLFGYKVTKMNRMDFKIDHLIPLCMGGSNNVENLWPQHKSVYEHTDPAEPQLCDRLKHGELTQAHAVSIIKKIKLNPRNSARIIADEIRN